MASQHGAAVAERRRDPALGGLFDDAEPYAPPDLFLERWTIDLGGPAVEALAVGPAHTDGDVAVSVSGEGVVAAGDVVFAGFHFNYEEAAPERLGEALARLRELAAPVLVPGHGPVGGAELLDAQARYHEAAARLVRGATTPDEGAARVRAAFPSYRYPAGAASAAERLRLDSGDVRRGLAAHLPGAGRAVRLDRAAPREAPHGVAAGQGLRLAGDQLSAFSHCGVRAAPAAGGMGGRPTAPSGRPVLLIERARRTPVFHSVAAWPRKARAAVDAEWIES
jgi:glyoxylase-like metal-dependent hydrolase (beta-lactamase superfamily II)